MSKLRIVTKTCFTTNKSKKGKLIAGKDHFGDDYLYAYIRGGRRTKWISSLP